MTFGLFNIIVAIYVENTVAAAKYNDLRQKQERLMNQKMFTDQVLNLLRVIWEHVQEEGGELVTKKRHGDPATTEFGPEAVQSLRVLHITPSFFKELCSNQAFRDSLRQLDIPDEEQLDLFDTLDIDGGGTLD